MATETREFVAPHMPHPPRQGGSNQSVMEWANDLTVALTTAFRDIRTLMMPHSGRARVTRQLLGATFILEADGLVVLVSSSGAVTSDVTTPISNGDPGSLLVIINVGTQAITFKDAAACSLGADITLGADDALFVAWDDVNSRWIRISSANN